MNFIDKYMTFTEPLTEAPREFHYYMAYTLLSCAVGKKAWYTGSGSFNMSPNLWFVLVGPSSITKKSTMLNIALWHILARCNFQFQRYANGGSQENFIETLSKNATGIISHSEFSSLMSWINKDYNVGLTALLSDLFDQPQERKHSVGTRSKREDFTIIKPFINIVAVTNIDWMNEALKESGIAGGFIPRFNLVLSQSSGKCLPETPDPNEQIRAELIWALEKINSKESVFGKMTYTEQARKAHSEWYVEFKKQKIYKASANLVPCLDRRMPDLHKFSMLNCIMRNDGESCNEMNLDDFIKAEQTIRQIEEYTTQVISDKIALTSWQVQRNRVLALIEKGSNNNGGCPHSYVLRGIKAKGKDVKEILDTLIEEKRITVTKNGAGQRPVTLYCITPEDNNENDT